MKTAIITTTINIPTLLKDYAKNAQDYGHQDLFFVVIGDKKSPPDTHKFCSMLQTKFNYPVYYQDIDIQFNYLERFPKLWEHLPFNSIQRRNIGLLFAYERGADIIITIDDDNLVISEQDFVGSHSIIGMERELISYSSKTGWLNICEFLQEANNNCFYHRGYPSSQKGRAGESNFIKEKIKGKVVVNAGLWLDDPDVDAVSRLNYPVRATWMKAEYAPTAALGKGTWSPFNSQNTALSREVLPAYFLSPYIGRYDDIWASYIVKKVADHLGHFVTCGYPLVRQIRNPHDIWKDLDKEREGSKLTDRFTDILRKIRLTQQDYHGCFKEIVRDLNQEFSNDKLFGPEEITFLQKFREGLEIWSETFEIINK
ncbi:MAG: hypothetical protein WC650_00330 [Candidatus Doudnabacteria bacterium]